MVAFASSLDQAGPLARTVRDAAIMLRSMAGPDPKDSTCSPISVPDYEAAVGRSVKGMKIGVPKEYRLEGMSSEIEACGRAAPNGFAPRAQAWSTSACPTRPMRCLLII